MKHFLVLIPLYNKASTISRAIESVLVQDFQDFDLLVIDDGSTDHSYKVATAIQSPKLHFIQQKNKGVSYTRNKGIEKAIKGRYKNIAFLDADDYWRQNHLTELVRLQLEFPEVHIVANNYKQRVSKHKYSSSKFSNLSHTKIRLLESFFENNFLNSILTSSSFSMKLIDTKALFYNEKLSHTEDTDFLIRAGINKKIAFNPTVTAIIDQTAENRSDQTSINKRTIADFDFYEENNPNVLGLKKYLDINRFAIAISYRLENDLKNATLYQHKINPDHLTVKQKKLLNMSSRQLKALKRTQTILGNLGFRLRTGR